MQHTIAEALTEKRFEDRFAGLRIDQRHPEQQERRGGGGGWCICLASSRRFWPESITNQAEQRRVRSVQYRTAPPDGWRSPAGIPPGLALTPAGRTLHGYRYSLPAAI